MDNLIWRLDLLHNVHHAPHRSVDTAQRFERFCEHGWHADDDGVVMWRGAWWVAARRMGCGKRLECHFIRYFIIIISRNFWLPFVNGWMVTLACSVVRCVCARRVIRLQSLQRKGFFLHSHRRTEMNIKKRPYGTRSTAQRPSSMSINTWNTCISHTHTCGGTAMRSGCNNQEDQSAQCDEYLILMWIAHVHFSSFCQPNYY